MIYYRGSFADIEDNVYVVDIQVKNLTDDGTIHELIFSDDSPCIITTKSEGLFSPIKSRGCTLSLVTSELLLNIWSSTTQGVEVNVYNTNGWDVDMTSTSIPAVYTCIFHGFLTPCAYTQGYSDSIETLELEAVEALSTLKDIDYTPYNGTDNQIVAFKYILKKLLYDVCGYDGKLYFPRSFSSVDGTSFNRYSGTVLIDSVAISESNFYDDDETHTPWKCYDVINEMMKYLNCTLVPYGKDIWVVDYNYINAKGALWGTQGNDTQYYKCYNLDNISTTSDFSTNTFDNVIQKNNYSDGGQSITLDDVYNKISVSENTYPVEELIPNPFDESLININQELGISASGTTWTQTTTSGILWWKTTETVTLATDYQTFDRITPDKSKWKHFFYRHSDRLINPTYTEYPYCDAQSTSIFTNNDINKYCNTIGCLLQNYAFIKNSDKIPSSLDWNKYITFFCFDDTSGTMTTDSVMELSDLPVLEYTSDEAVLYKPNNGNSYITLNMSLWYQDDISANSSGVHTINSTSGKEMYKTNPIDDVIDTESVRARYPVKSWVVPGGSQTGGAHQASFQYQPHRTPSHEDYGKGWRLLKLKLQIGNYYWDGSSWTNNPSTFYISFNNNPDIGKDEEQLLFKWLTPVYNTTYTDKIGKNVVAIPINSGVSGRLKLTIYPPLHWDPNIITAYGSVGGALAAGAHMSSWNYNGLSQCIFMKDFEMNYVYVDTSPWWIDSGDNNTDIEYINLISNDNVIDGDEIELKINSWYDDKPISRSYTIYSNKYISNIEHSTIGVYQPQEKNIINNYYNHYSSPKLMYNCSVKDYYYPYTKFAVRCLTSNVSNEDNTNDTYTNDDYKFLLDTQEWDIKNRKNQIQLIQY